MSDGRDNLMLVYRHQLDKNVQELRPGMGDVRSRITRAEGDVGRAVPRSRR